MAIEEIIAKSKQYAMVLLKRGPNYTNMEPDALQQNQMQHLQYLFGLRDQGILAINGPVTDESDIVGVSIYNSADKQQVESYVTNDPGVKSGRFVYEIYSWFSIPGDKLG
ncbi:MAG TPA: YciI family protein [Chitinophagaceae bacterium]|nr:YciI family protein [Chitinophagaceae bacterium]